jgi:hypothetical protein
MKLTVLSLAMILAMPAMAAEEFSLTDMIVSLMQVVIQF